ncbi:Gfo/Idh/MocA family oxidoreductase [Variovorax paradoxus]|nr:Gfo/Idh/MocA family oxidoreductase [Variovorax paradoxus]
MNQLTLERPSAAAADAVRRRPRLGFLGVGWIGRHRMEAIAADGAAEVAALCDPEEQAFESALRNAPRAARAASFDALLEQPLDGIVIATPSALHAGQAEAALARGMAVFCQKPLGCTAIECRRVVSAARAADRLLAVDLSYRQTAAMRCIRRAVAAGEIGEVYAVDLVFHNAYGPDKPWFRDPQRSGGGCVIDLGIHLVDLALWTLGFPRVHQVESRLWAGGRALAPRPEVVEDHALAQLDMDGGAVARLACSWNLHAGRDAVIEASFHGTRGGVRLCNCGGSFYDFRAERFKGTRSILLAEPPDDWGGRAPVAWARRLAAGSGFDPEVERVVDVAAVLDAIYGR